MICGLVEDCRHDAAADVRRLINAGINNKDNLTISAGIRRAARLSREEGFDLTNPAVVKILGLDKLPR